MEAEARLSETRCLTAARGGRPTAVSVSTGAGSTVRDLLNPELPMTPNRRARSSLPLLAALALVATSLASAQGIEAPRVPLRTALNEINTLRSEYASAYNKKDAAALTAMYLPDAVAIR